MRLTAFVMPTIHKTVMGTASQPRSQYGLSAKTFRVGERLDHDAVEHGDERREDLHTELKIRAQRGHIVHYA